MMSAKSFGVLMGGLVVSILFSGCGSDSADEEKNQVVAAYESNYVLDLPENWKQLPADKYPEALVFAAKESNSPARISPVVAVSKEYLRPVSMDDFVVRNLEEVRRTSQDFRMITSEDVSAGAVNRVLVEYAETRSEDGSVLGVYSLYAVPENYEVSYVITIVFDGDETENRKKELKDMLLSFRIE